MSCTANGENARPKWRLVHEETFDTPLPESPDWVQDTYGPDSPWEAGPIDDDGIFFQLNGGEAFRKQLDSFRTYRRRMTFGHDGWLTLELAGRDRDKDGMPETPPTFTQTVMPDGRTVGRIDEPDHHGGVVIRNTRALPARYRIEMTLVTLDFGGSRYDRWNYDGRINGYNAEGGPKTHHPWSWFSGKEIESPYEEWHEARRYNGFYFLTIVDHANAAPRNNVFIHMQRKVGIDTYIVPDKGDGSGLFDVCDPANKTYYRNQDNPVNALFFYENPDGKSIFHRYGVAMARTECGTAYGYEGGRTQVVSAAQLVPELMPRQTYTFAIERDATGYTLEFTGFFRFVGQKTFRYHRNFVEDGRAIWHYNQTPDEYDGSFDSSWTLEGPFGTHTLEHRWPAGSAYPDFFIIGDPHTNFYEGTASIDDIRLYVPADE